ncbi:hypothetical protein QFC19_004952 [Naganishia cerealis]|uniref:Uncharacterized protein n=1 Tax=Naganishia cerealis TaxID=610337 RepID=A0ACC2VTR6_9TREE|nr:hypothetical protein QFC19_004952 [Naganishia cerealis]
MVLTLYDKYIARVNQLEKFAAVKKDELSAEKYRKLEQEIEAHRTQFRRIQGSVLKLHERRNSQPKLNWKAQSNSSNQSSISFPEETRELLESFHEVRATFSRISEEEADNEAKGWANWTDWQQSLSALDKLEIETLSNLEEQGLNDTLKTPSVATSLPTCRDSSR